MTARRRRDEPVRVAVVGVGGMGRNHARVYSTMKGVDLVAIVDPDSTRAREVAMTYGGSPLPSTDALLDVDAVSVAAPSVLHADIGCDLLERGVHCLIEKPLATNRADCERLIAAASAGDARLLVGHIERFNPAVQQLREIIDPTEILAVSARRMSAVSSRISDIDVVSDLMVHDLDIVRSLVGDAVVEVTARGVEGPNGADHVTGLLTFANGQVASLTASRITQNKIRSLEVTTADRFFTVDYPSQELLIYRQGRIGGIDGPAGEDARYVLDVGTERVFVAPREPLAEELMHFMSVVRGDEVPEIDGITALAALDLVWQIQSQVSPVAVDA